MGGPAAAPKAGKGRAGLSSVSEASGPGRALGVPLSPPGQLNLCQPLSCPFPGSLQAACPLPYSPPFVPYYPAVLEHVGGQG